MNIVCEAEKLFPQIEILIKRLSDGESLSKREDKSLRKLIDEYWEIECPEKQCAPNSCPFAKPDDWIEFHGYKTLADLLWYFEYEGIKKLQLKNKGSIDTLDAHWAKRPGHYNP